MDTSNKKYTQKNFSSDQDIKWCPGCGNYSILKQVQTILPEIGFPKEKIVFVSGIGCSSRFPYYMDTFGLHGIHGRAPALATGIKLANPDLNVWIITGDGDGLSIGGNHLIHLLRRNLDVNILLFNNEIYGLTKGQHSPTSKLGFKTKSSPLGTIDYPFNPLSLVLGAGASFIARTTDRDPKHLREMLLRAQEHRGTSFLEIYQNCNVFNDGVFENFTEKSKKVNHTLYLNHGEFMIFGSEKQYGIRLDGIYPKVISLQESSYSFSDIWIHDENDRTKAEILTRFFGTPGYEKFPRPFGVFYKEERPTYDMLFQDQISLAQKNHPMSLDILLSGDLHWKI